MTDPDVHVVTVNTTIVIECDPAIPPPYDGYLTLRRLDPPQMLEATTHVRPELTEDEVGAFSDWVTGRIHRLLKPDGGEPDRWEDLGDGWLRAWHEPDDLDWHPIWLD